MVVGWSDFGRRIAAKSVLGLLQPLLEISRLDHPHKGVDDVGDPTRLARRDRAAGERRGAGNMSC